MLRIKTNPDEKTVSYSVITEGRENELWGNSKLKKYGYQELILDLAGFLKTAKEEECVKEIEFIGVKTVFEALQRYNEDFQIGIYLSFIDFNDGKKKSSDFQISKADENTKPVSQKKKINLVKESQNDAAVIEDKYEESSEVSQNKSNDDVDKESKINLTEESKDDDAVIETTYEESTETPEDKTNEDVYSYWSNTDTPENKESLKLSQTGNTCSKIKAFFIQLFFVSLSAIIFFSSGFMFLCSLDYRLRRVLKLAYHMSPPVVGFLSAILGIFLAFKLKNKKILSVVCLILLIFLLLQKLKESFFF